MFMFPLKSLTRKGLIYENHLDVHDQMLYYPSLTTHNYMATTGACNFNKQTFFPGIYEEMKQFYPYHKNL